MKIKPECHVCDKKFDSVQELEEHLREHHKEEKGKQSSEFETT
ncbi:C2H2-type zinc finger protein [Candidatus Thorarchaeota archaeon]|nr:MAG: C2H2-type zinc finger protein [Candidatus Thorarchaeota archaeon]